MPVSNHFQSQQSESHRLEESRTGKPWKKWGPYLSERQWGTVREDYSESGNAWDYFTHDQSRSRAYRWGEDGLAGFSDEKQRLCFSIALWNEADSILKERLFGLTNSEGNHGEDVKEYYFYLDSTPTHSYMKYLYKYPQAAYPYVDLVKTNRERTRQEQEYELIDTGVFNEDRYFDIFVEYAKASPEDILIRITAINRGPDAAPLHLLPTLWFRNTWDFFSKTAKPEIQGDDSGSVIRASHEELGERFLHLKNAAPLLVTENESNNELLFGKPNASPYVKDGIHQYIVSGQTDKVNPARKGTKASAHYQWTVPAGETWTVCLRLTDVATRQGMFDSFEDIMLMRQAEADGFYESITPPYVSEDHRLVMRQALAGMLWTKQYYYFELDIWLHEHGFNLATPPTKNNLRNAHWYHMINDDIISMPDKWEYPWYAAWDLAFHTLALSMVDIDFAKQQLHLMLREVYLHPNGQIPAYEWNFGDVNPPVHAWATLFLYVTEKEMRGEGDLNFLKHAFQKLLLNFTWWVNRKDPGGRNVFEGGFLGLDNIGVFDRSKPLPTGGFLEQADGTAWMALFSQNMLEIAMELALHDPAYIDLVHKFVEHFLWIAGAMDRVGEHQDEMWDEEDGFFYDLLRLPDGSGVRIKVRSLVGLLPLCATSVVSPEFFERFPKVKARIQQFLSRRPDLVVNIPSPIEPGLGNRRLLAILPKDKLKRILNRMLDEDRFFSAYGVRSLSKWHKDQPYVFQVHGEEYRVAYLPAESDNGMFGGNSNWRGPIWFPMNALIIRALLQFYLYYGDEFKVECPTGSGRELTLFEIAQELAGRLNGIFLRDEKGRRPVFGNVDKFQNDPHWRDYLLFYEYFHGDNGAGIGASHQTGWTGVVARLIQFFGRTSAVDLLENSGSIPTAKPFGKQASDLPVAKV